jgi:hypothetical protein
MNPKNFMKKKIIKKTIEKYSEVSAFIKKNKDFYLIKSDVMQNYLCFTK